MEDEKLLIDALRRLEFYRSFISGYSGTFSRNFQSYCSAYDRRLSDGAIRTLGLRVYHLMFPRKVSREVLERFRDTVEELVRLGEDIKPVFTKTFLAMVRDFAEHLVSRGNGMDDLKPLLSVMDVYLTVVDEVYINHIRLLREELGREKSNERLIALNLMSRLRGGEGNVEVLSFYREVPILCRGTVKYTGLSFAVLALTDCPYIMAFYPGSVVFIKADIFPRPVKTTVESVDYNSEELTLSGFEFSEMPQERRRFVRVRPSEDVEVVLRAGGRELFGKMADISIGGMGVFLEGRPALSQGDALEVEFRLDGRLLRVRGEVRYTKKMDHLYRVGIEFYTTAVEEEVISEYVMKVQLDILKELKLAV